MSSQIKSSSGSHYTKRSMNGIITFDDGAGNIIEDGQITSNGVVVDGDISANNLLEADEDETITGTWSFTTIPYSTITPSANTQIANKLYVDTEANTKVSKSGDETINGIKTFVDSPIVPNPTTSTQATNKGSVETYAIANFVSISDNQTIGGLKTFSNPLFLSGNPTNANEASNKAYVDTKVSLTGDESIGGIKTYTSSPIVPNPTTSTQATNKGSVETFGYANFVTLTDNDDIGGLKTFTNNLFLANSTPSSALMAASKGYVDTQIAGITPSGVVLTTTNQSVGGVKTFTDGLKYDLAPSANTDVVNKLALDTAISAIPAPSGVVLTTTNQNVAGVKTFTDTLQLNTNSGNAIKIWNGNGNNSASTAMGTNALNSITTGSNNTAMGISTLNTLTSGNSNTAFGAYAGTSVQGTGTTSVGAFSLTTNTADDTTAVGYEALKINTSGANNTAVGSGALKTNQGTSQNTAIGANCLTANTGSSNTGVGSNALLNNSTGSSNTAIGAYTMNNNTIGQQNIAIGLGALYDNIEGDDNIAIGYEANDDNTTADNNIAIGYRAIQKITGDNNISIGKNNFSIYDETGSNRNIVIGTNSGTRLGSSRTIVIGYQSGIATNSTENVIIGNYSGNNMGTGCSKSVIIGDDCDVVTGAAVDKVIVIGNEVYADEPYFIYMGRGIQMSNVVSGVQSYTSSGIYRSTQMIIWNQNSSGSKWVGGVIQSYIAANNGGTSGFPGGLVFRTKRATGGSGTSGLTDAFFVDALGNMGIGTSTIANGKLEISGYKATTYPYVRFISENTTKSGGYMGYTNNSAGTSRHISAHFSGGMGCNYCIFHSDRRIKNEIEDVPDNLALQQVRDIPCRYYNYIDRVNKRTEKVVGFIAQEVNEVLPSAVHTTKNIIPNEYRELDNITWTDGDVDASGNITNYKMSCDLTDVSGVQYKFFVAQDENDDAEEKDVVGNEDNTFTFEEKYEKVFCFGKQVDDFLNIDKNQIFALHHSAIQELDKQQIADKARITELEQQVNDLTTRLQALEALFLT
jgi:hypothetical protein